MIPRFQFNSPLPKGRPPMLPPVWKSMEIASSNYDNHFSVPKNRGRRAPLAASRVMYSAPAEQSAGHATESVDSCEGKLTQPRVKLKWDKEGSLALLVPPARRLLTIIRGWPFGWWLLVVGWKRSLRRRSDCVGGNTEKRKGRRTTAKTTLMETQNEKVEGGINLRSTGCS